VKVVFCTEILSARPEFGLRAQASEPRYSTLEAESCKKFQIALPVNKGWSIPRWVPGIVWLGVNNELPGWSFVNQTLIIL
jgi:hypothetical protein